VPTSPVSEHRASCKADDRAQARHVFVLDVIGKGANHLDLDSPAQEKRLFDDARIDAGHKRL